MERLHAIRPTRSRSLGALVAAALLGGAALLLSPTAFAGTDPGKGGFTISSPAARPPVALVAPRVTRIVPTLGSMPRLGPRPIPSTPTAPEPQPEPEQQEPEIVEPAGTGSVNVLATCSGAPCLGGAAVEIRVSGDVVATGRAGQALDVPAGSPFDAWIRLPGLADAPLVRRSVQDGLDANESRSLAVDVEVGRLAVEAHRNGRRVSAIVYLYRFPEDATIPNVQPSGTMSANGHTREVSADRYLLRVLGSGQTVERVIVIPASARRVVTVDLSR